MMMKALIDLLETNEDEKLLDVITEFYEKEIKAHRLDGAEQIKEYLFNVLSELTKNMVLNSLMILNLSNAINRLRIRLDDAVSFEITRFAAAISVLEVLRLIIDFRNPLTKVEMQAMSELLDSIKPIQAINDNKEMQKAASDLSKRLKAKVNDFFYERHYLNSRDTKKFKQEVTSHLTCSREAVILEKASNWKNIVANVFVALTGVGLFALAAKAVYAAYNPGSPFLFRLARSKPQAAIDQTKKGLSRTLHRFSVASRIG